MSVKKQVILTSLMLAMLSVSVAAVGIATPYWKENPLVMQPGELKDFTLNLQNMVGDKDITLRGELVDSGGVAEITDSNTDYLLRSQTADTYVHVRVRVPNDAKVGEIYTLKFSFTTVTQGESGGVALGLSIDKSFDVIVGEAVVEEETQPAGFGSDTYAITLVVLAILLLLWWWITQGKKRKR